MLTQAQTRLAGMKSINAKLDLGHGCSTASIESKLTEARKKLEIYNTLLAKATAAASDFKAVEDELAGISRKVLPGIAMRYEKESKEYEAVGGVRPSERKRPRRLATA